MQGLRKLLTYKNEILRRKTNINHLPKTLLFYQSINDHVFKSRVLSKFPLKIYNIKNEMNIKYYSSEHASSFNRIQSIELARQFISTLNTEERGIIKEQLLECERQQNLKNDTTVSVVPRPTWRQLSLVCLQCGLPFIGFGFVDNFLMIIAGDLIESWIGVVMPISTMAAAGLGNAFSDVAGIGLAHHIEGFSMKFVKIPQLTAEQWNLGIVNWASAISKALCIFIGCVIGMAPLLFIDDKKDKDNDKEQTSKP